MGCIFGRKRDPGESDSEDGEQSPKSPTSGEEKHSEAESDVPS